MKRVMLRPFHTDNNSTNLKKPLIVIHDEGHIFPGFVLMIFEYVMKLLRW